MALALTIVGIIGNITSICLFLSPLPTFYKVTRQKSTEEFSAVPYVVTLLNCLLWLLYGSPWVNWGLLIVSINGFGTVIQICYLIIFLWFAKNKHTLVTNVTYISLVVLAFGAVVLITMLGLPTKSLRKTIVGVLCVIVGTTMYISPLSVMKTVIRTKSTKYMPFFLSLFNLLNGMIWAAYAIIARDVYIAIPNGLGVLFAICQLVLYGCYYDPKWKAKPILPAIDSVESSLEIAKDDPVVMEKSFTSV